MATATLCAREERTGPPEPPRPLKVLAISHSCVVDVNQQLYVALRRLPGGASDSALPGVSLELIVPAVWKNEYGGGALTPRLLPSVDFPVHRLPVVRPGNNTLYFYRRLPVARLRRFRPDVVLSSEEPWSLSGLQAIWLARRLGAPLVFQTNQNIPKRYPPPFSWIERLSYGAAGAALAYSEEARAVMLRKGLRKPAHVVPYATDISLFGEDSSAVPRAEREPGDVVVGFLGRFVPEKGLDTLVAAAARIPELRVLLVGAGPEEARLRRAVAAAGLQDRFVFAGSVPHREAGRYLRSMDIFVLPSRTTPRWKEQFGRVLIEALACGVPVVGSDSGQIPYLIEDTGGGLVFREGDADDLAQKLLALLRDPARRQQMAARGGAAVRERYTCEAVARRLHAILQEVCAKNRLPRENQ